MTEMYLFRVSVVCGDSWRKKMKPIYVVAKSRVDAAEYVDKHISWPYEAGKASNLGRQLSIYMYSGN